MNMILAALVEAHPPPGLHGGCLYRRVGVLQPVPQRVVGGIGEVGVGLALEGGYLGRDVGEVSGYVLDGVDVVPGAGDRVLALAHPLRIRQGRRILSKARSPGPNGPALGGDDATEKEVGCVKNQRAHARTHAGRPAKPWLAKASRTSTTPLAPGCTAPRRPAGRFARMHPRNSPTP